MEGVRKPIGWDGLRTPPTRHYLYFGLFRTLQTQVRLYFKNFYPPPLLRLSLTLLCKLPDCRKMDISKFLMIDGVAPEDLLI